jgi:hypothetical protein
MILLKANGNENILGGQCDSSEREFLLEERYGDYFHFITMVKIESFMTSLSIG